MNWQSFWDQYRISVHGRTQLSDLKKLTYLKFAQKEGSAKHIVEGCPAQEMIIVKMLTVCIIVR